MGVERIEKPEWFTLEAYNKLKAKGLRDHQIWNNHLFVSYGTFMRFKNEIGAKGGFRGGLNRKLPKDEYVYHLNKVKGMTKVEIARQYDCTRARVSAAVRRHEDRVKGITTL